MPPEQLDRVAAADAISARHILPSLVTPEVTVESSTQMDGICVTAPQERSSIKEAWELVNNYSGGVTLRGVTQTVPRSLPGCPVGNAQVPAVVTCL